MQLQFEIIFKASWHSMNGVHFEHMGCQLFMKEKLNRNCFFISIRLMEVQFEITFKALWHSMNGGHLESMGCQLFPK